MCDFRFSIIGSGNVGKAIGKVLHRFGYCVVFYDVDRSKLVELEMLRYNVSYSLEDCIRRSNISFVCVPTPTIDGKHYSGHVRQVVLDIVNLVRGKEEYHLIVIKSTVLPFDLEEIYMAAGKGNFGICFSPEFLRSESAELDFINIPKVIIGVKDDKPKEILKKFYEDFSRKTYIQYELVFTDLKTASLIKYASNCMLATKISLFNEIREIAERIEADIATIIKNTITDDKKTNEWYRRNFLKSGFDDECLPKDLDALLNFCFSLGQNMKILQAVKEVNEDIRSTNSAQNTQT